MLLKFGAGMRSNWPVLAKEVEMSRPEKPAEDRVARTPDKSFRFSLFEFGGALGDLGTFLPLAAALITLNHVNATSVFVIGGLAYIAAGLFYRLPVPVQPLKAVAAIAVAGGLSASIISASGLIMAAFLLLLAATKTVSLLAKLFPRAIIRGIQLGVALLLVKAGLALASKQQVIAGGGDASLMIGSLSFPAGLLLAPALGVAFVGFVRNRKLPASLILLSLGMGVGLFWGSFSALRGLNLGLGLPALALPSLGDLTAAMVLLVIPQIPLTLGNAVFATADTARTYFGPLAKKVTPRALLTTMGLANLGAGLLGGIPVCHGSGGLTAHFRLGARTGGANIMVGVLFLALALFSDGHVLPVFSLIPYAVLSVLVVFAGIQHALLVRDLKGKREVSVSLAVAIAGFAASSLAIGLGAGLGLSFLLAAFSRGRVARFSLFRRVASKMIAAWPQRPMSKGRMLKMKVEGSE